MWLVSGHSVATLMIIIMTLTLSLTSLLSVAASKNGSSYCKIGRNNLGTHNDRGRDGGLVVTVRASLWKTAHELFFIGPSPNHPTSRHYNHLILHHYRLSNFIKPHTWFWLCCRATTFQTSHFSKFYYTGDGGTAERAHFVRELVPLCAGSACAVCANPPRELLEKSGPKVTFSGKPFALGLARRVLGSLAFAAALWNTPHFIRGC